MHDSYKPDLSDFDPGHYLELDDIGLICRKVKDIKTVDKCNDWVEYELKNERRKKIIAALEQRKDELWNE